MSEKTLYSVLEVSREASAEVIDAAYSRIKARLEPQVAAGDEAALVRMTAITEAHRTLSNATLRARYDRSLAQRATDVRVAPAVSETYESGGRSWLPVVLVAVAVLGAGGWYYSYQQRVERAKAERVARESAEALAKAEAERERLESSAAEQTAARQRALEDARYRQWVEQARRDGAENLRRNEVARRQVEHEERRQRERDERMKEMERQREETAARRRLEDEKRRLRELQYQNSRY